VKWIPTAARQPEHEGTYLTTTSKGAVRTNHYYVKGDTWGYGNDAIAWMPLPEAYNGEIQTDCGWK
jgi:hypothetical protein